MSITYRDGKKLPQKMMCHRCQAKRDGIMRRSGPAWDVHLTCGHVKRVGWTMPTEELRRRGLVTTETPVDPRKVYAQKQKAEDAERQQREASEEIMRRSHMTRGKYL